MLRNVVDDKLLSRIMAGLMDQRDIIENNIRITACITHTILRNYVETARNAHILHTRVE